MRINTIVVLKVTIVNETFFAITVDFTYLSTFLTSCSRSAITADINIFTLY